MKTGILLLKDKLLGRHLEFRVRLFNILAMTGVIISIISALVALLNGEGWPAVITSTVTTVIAALLLIYATRTGKYQRCYTITIVTIFMIFFSLIFVIGGGYSGGMPYFFVFAILFTVFMLDGARALVIACSELLLYIGLCVYAFYRPENIATLPDATAEFLDIVTGFSIVSVSLGITLYLHFRLYNRQQKELEAAREEAFAANDAKSLFLANMSHEIRTPIGILLGMNEVILRETDSEQIKDYVRRAENAGQHLLTLINNILDVSAIEKGKLDFIEESYETAELIYALSVDGEDLARRQSLRFETAADETLPRTLSGDMPHIRHIVTNFLGNAAKYTEKGGIMLAFSTLQSQNAGEIILRISVVDTGIGIKPENMPHLFEVFTRGDTGGRSIEGTGLGLAIAKEYAEAMGGRVYVESEFGRGSIFTVELTQKINDPAPMGDWKQASEKSLSASKEITFTAPDCDVLIVDDNSENRQLMQSLLKGTLMRTDTASSGEECLSMVEKNGYDVILMDYMMPGIDGEETLRRLKEANGFDTPVVALTANVVAGVREKLLNAGFVRYISKPVRWRDLKNALLDILPADRVRIDADVSPKQLSVDIKEQLAQELALYGVVFEDGLRYVDGDIAKYGKSALIAAEGYDTAAAAIHAFAEDTDWTNMKFRIHALKGNAKNLGANALSETAAKLERLCETGDGAYIAALLPVLYIEWERANDGLKIFTEKLKVLLPAEERQTIAAPSLNELRQFLKFNQYQDAMDALSVMIKTGGAPEKIQKLHEIRKKTDDLQFRDAERLLVTLLESEV